MTGQFLARVVAALALAVPSLAMANAAIDLRDEDVRVSGDGSASLPPYLQCVPYARRVSGIQIFGDAHTWWDQAAGRYERGYTPRVGAVMTFKPYGNMHLGHVAAISRIVDSRTVLLRHSNWSPINGRRGQIEDNVRAIDVSENNDWSEVRVWFDPIQALGGTHWPVQGFIYNRPSRRLDESSVLARAAKRGDAPKMQLAKAERQPSPAQPSTASYARSADPIGEIIAARSRSSTFAICD